jgi:hypothetical protein
MKVPRQCPLALVVKVRWKGNKTFGCEEGIDKGEAGREVEQGSTALSYTPHSDIKPWFKAEEERERRESGW